MSFLLAFSASIITYLIVYIFSWETHFQLLLLPFSSSLVIHALLGIFGTMGDKINAPERVLFFARFENLITGSTIALFVISLIFVILHSLWTTLWFITPIILTLLYPKIKRVQIVLIKNLFEALICSSGIFLISSFYHSFNMSISILFLYFFVASFIITIIFDIKDIKGDFWDNIYTFPLQYGIKKTKVFCILLNVLLALF